MKNQPNDFFIWRYFFQKDSLWFLISKFHRRRLLLVYNLCPEDDIDAVKETVWL